MNVFGEILLSFPRNRESINRIDPRFREDDKMKFNNIKR